MKQSEFRASPDVLRLFIVHCTRANRRRPAPARGTSRRSARCKWRGELRAHALVASGAGNFARTRSLQAARGTSRARVRYEFRVPIPRIPNLKIHSPCDFKKRTSPFKNIVRGKTCTRREFRPFACLPAHENQSTRSPPLHSEASGGIDCSAQRFALYGLIERLQSS